MPGTQTGWAPWTISRSHQDFQSYVDIAKPQTAPKPVVLRGSGAAMNGFSSAFVFYSISTSVEVTAAGHTQAPISPRC